MANDVVLTPMMKQFFELKAKHPDAVMLFRCGDFYETYSEDAILASEILGRIPVSCPRYLIAEAGQRRQACGYLRPVGRPETDQETGEERYYRTGDSGGGHQ